MRRPKLPVTTGESALSQEVPFSLLWLQGLDPQTFTPHTWEHGRQTSIYLRTPDGQIQVKVERWISHYLDDTKELHDEVHLPESYTVSQLRYNFNEAGELTNFDPSLDVTDHLQDMVSRMSNLVHIPGSTITAFKFDYGQESKFVSDGTQWIDANTGRSQVPSAPPAIAAARLALDSPHIEQIGN